MPDGGETDYVPTTRLYVDKNGVQTDERAIPHTNKSDCFNNGKACVVSGASTAPDGKFVCLKSDYQKQLEDEAAPLRDKALADIDGRRLLPTGGKLGLSAANFILATTGAMILSMKVWWQRYNFCYRCGSNRGLLP